MSKVTNTPINKAHRIAAEIVLLYQAGDVPAAGALLDKTPRKLLPLVVIELTLPIRIPELQDWLSFRAL